MRFIFLDHQACKKMKTVAPLQQRKAAISDTITLRQGLFMLGLRVLSIAAFAGLLSACALFQPVPVPTPVDFADDCIAREALIEAPAPTFLESAVAATLHRCAPDIKASEAALLASFRGDGRSTNVKLGELHQHQHDLARDTIALNREK